MRLISALLAVIIFSLGLVGCESDTANYVQEGNGASGAISGSEGSESDALAGINLEDYTAMPAGEIWVILKDGTVDKFENSSEDNSGKRYAYGVDYFLEAINDDEAYYTDRFEGATYIIHAQVNATKSDWLTRSGDTFETAIELTTDEGYLASRGMEAITALTVEVDDDEISEQKIMSGDSIIVASQNLDFHFDNLYAPTKVLKTEKSSPIP